MEVNFKELTFKGERPLVFIVNILCPKFFI